MSYAVFACKNPIADSREARVVRPTLRVYILGSFNIDDGDENVSFKMNSRFFNLCGVYSNLLKMASVGEFPCS